MNCPYCHKEAVWCENREIYGKNFGKSFMCYLCRDCNAYVGCHNNTKKPLGIMANKELRELRKKVHAHIDPIWKSGRMKRSEMYSKLSDIFGFEVHVGEADLSLCKKILEINLE